MRRIALLTVAAGLALMALGQLLPPEPDLSKPPARPAQDPTGLVTGHAAAGDDAPAAAPLAAARPTVRAAQVAEPDALTTGVPTPPAPAVDGRENPSAGEGVRLRSTAYCLTSGMASGRRPYVGAVAANRYRLGTYLDISPTPWGPGRMRFRVEDRHARSDPSGFPTELDFAMPTECDRALAWGNRRFVTVRVVDPQP